MITTTGEPELTVHERFWIEVIRVASRGTDPKPTLARTQQLRRLFEVDPLSLGQRHESDDDRGGLAGLPYAKIGAGAAVPPEAGDRHTLDLTMHRPSSTVPARETDTDDA